MWLIQNNNVLIEWPDDAPVPPGSSEVELPEDYFDEPGTYTFVRGRIVRRPEAEIATMKAYREENSFSKDEITRLKTALREGKL